MWSLIWGAMVLAIGVPVWAQEGQIAIPEIQYGSPESFAEFHGFVNLEYIDFEKEGNLGGTSTFDQHNFYFNAIAKVRQNVTVFGEVEYEHGGEEILLDRAFIDWGLYGEHLNLRVGKFYSPFGLEIREYQAPVRKLASRPQMASALLFNEWTEVGANLYGQLETHQMGFDYNIALVNGPGATDDNGNAIQDLIENPKKARQNRDNNSNRTVIGRVGANLPLGVGIGLSYASGNYANTGTPPLDFTLTGVDADFRMNGMDVRGEWVSRTVDVTTTTKLDSSSYYVQASNKWLFRKEVLNYIEPVIRYDSLEPDEDTNGYKQTRISIGLNYSPYPHFIVRAEYQTNDREDDPTTSTVDESHLKDDGILFSLVVDF